MCAINPKHKLEFKISAYTSLNMTQEDFAKLVRTTIVLTEMSLNEDMRIRWHVTELKTTESS